MLPKITIAISSTIGERKWLEITVPLWLKQNYDNLEIVIINDGSPDIDEDFVKSLSPRIKYKKIGETRSGYPFAKNACVENSTGEYVLLVDNDILPPNEDYLKNIYNFFNSLPTPGFVGGALYDKGAELTKYYGIYYSKYGINIHKNPVDKKTLTESSELIQIGSYHGGAVFFKKSLWEELGGYDTMQPFMLDDTDLSARASINGYNCYLYNRELMEHAGISNHDNQDYFAWKFKYYFSAISTIILKNYSSKNLFTLLLFFITSPFIYIATAIKKKNLKIIKAGFESIGILVKNLPKILQARKKIQSTRKISKDSFLFIKSPF
jgi:GT2 family glycosyltransferase